MSKLLELYSMPICPYVQRVRIALLDKKISHKVHIIDITKPRPDWFLKLNPVGKCPVLVDDGKIITESSHILHYLEDSKFFFLFSFTHSFIIISMFYFIFILIISFFFNKPIFFFFCFTLTLLFFFILYSIFFFFFKLNIK